MADHGIILKTRGLARSFGALRAVDGVDIDVKAGTITGLIGPNGAGKSTLFGLIAGEVQPSHGQVVFDGQTISGLRPEQVFRHGLARTFQIPRPFPQMSVLENVVCAASGQSGERFWNNWFRPSLVAAEERRLTERAMEIIEFTGLKEVVNHAAGLLSGGQQKLLELARVMMIDPKLILLDEPTAGVNPTLIETLIEKIVALNARGTGFLIVEHNMDLVMRICGTIVVMAQGKVIFEGAPAEVMREQKVIDAYLGDVTQEEHA
ncbi:ABC transporter ATP-binding protein [Rhizobium sp. RU36D]|uniref:ABC transporter ATP-binding protein n=1 Tax=Rhizobium sp. RU36D TaxID=1907415 RepID=UPI0009D86E5F|nr:ABC transporter ATP-binding protein [Rhizobium sp. RU36D]SMC71453.1 branched-chain amino acid transport system ATP-binding protein/neutral amino acid transport system ATP-binding protein [Rhizobium sp. RU36D]